MRLCKCGKELLPHKRKWCSDACQRKYHERPYLIKKKAMNKCQHTFVHVGKVELPRKDIPTKPTDNADSFRIDTAPLYTPEYVDAVVCPYCGHTRHIHPDGTIEVVRDAGRVTFKKNDE